MLKLVVIIPAFNEESTIREVLNRMPELSTDGVKLTPVVIDDGSTDRTAVIQIRSDMIAKLFSACAS